MPIPGALFIQSEKYHPSQVWSHLLGVGMGSGKPIPRISTLPAVPAMYIKVRRKISFVEILISTHSLQLLAKADEIFKDKKTRDYVKVWYWFVISGTWCRNCAGAVQQEDEVDDVLHGHLATSCVTPVEKCYWWVFPAPSAPLHLFDSMILMYLSLVSASHIFLICITLKDLVNDKKHLRL